MHWRIGLTLALLLNGCASWAPPLDDPIRGGDSRTCSAPGACIDLVVAVDTSISSADIIGEPPPIFGNSEAGPGSVYWAALDGLDSAVRTLDSASAGVAVIGFAGGPQRPIEDAGWIEAELTNDFASIHAATARMRARGASGRTCHACAVLLASSILAKNTRENRCPILLVLTDYSVTLPYGPGFWRENNQLVGKALRDTRIRRSTFVVVGSLDEEKGPHLQSVLEGAGSRMVLANNSTDIAEAIVEAANACAQ